MRLLFRPTSLRYVTLAATLLLTAAVAVAPAVANAQSSFPSSVGGCVSTAGTCVESPVEVAGVQRDAVWYLPNGQASALMLLEHGFDFAETPGEIRFGRQLKRREHRNRRGDADRLEEQIPIDAMKEFHSAHAHRTDRIAVVGIA